MTAFFSMHCFYKYFLEYGSVHPWYTSFPWPDISGIPTELNAACNSLSTAEKILSHLSPRCNSPTKPLASIGIFLTWQIRAGTFTEYAHQVPGCN